MDRDVVNWLARKAITILAVIVAAGIVVGMVIGFLVGWFWK